MGKHRQRSNAQKTTEELARLEQLLDELQAPSDQTTGKDEREQRGDGTAKAS